MHGVSIEDEAATLDTCIAKLLVLWIIVLHDFSLVQHCIRPLQFICTRRNRKAAWASENIG